jgi:hypothetical protein
MPSMFRLPQAQLLGVSGLPAAGARLYFFEPSTTTPKNAFSDAELAIPVAQGIAADANGAWPTIYMSPALYRVQVRAADAVTILQDVDPYDGGQAIGAGVVPVELGGTGGTTPTTARANLGIIVGQPQVTLASAAIVDLGAAASDNVEITGSANITGFGSAEAGREVFVVAAGGFLITHSAGSIRTPGGRNLLAAPGDSFRALSLGAGIWVVQLYSSQRGGDTVINGQPTTNRFVRFVSNNLNRFVMGASDEPELGGNAGSRYVLSAWSDAGAFLGTVFVVDRQDRRLRLDVNPMIGGHVVRAVRCSGLFHWNGSAVVSDNLQNVVSITRVGVGEYTVNMAVAEPTANIVPIVSGGLDGSGNGLVSAAALLNGTSFRILFRAGSAAADPVVSGRAAFAALW